MKQLLWFKTYGFIFMLFRKVNAQKLRNKSKLNGGVLLTINAMTYDGYR